MMLGTMLTNWARMTAGGTAGKLLVDEHLVNRCAVALVAALVTWLISMAWKNFRGK